MANQRAALFVRCTREEIAAIREPATREHRTISGYALYAVMGRVAPQEAVRQGFEHQVAPKSRRSNSQTLIPVPPHRRLHARSRSSWKTIALRDKILMSGLPAQLEWRRFVCVLRKLG